MNYSALKNVKNRTNRKIGKMRNVFSIVLHGRFTKHGDCIDTKHDISFISK